MSDRPTTIYVRHPPARGRDWIVSVASTPDQRFSTDREALRYAVERVRTDAAKGVAAEIRIEKEDGSWETLESDSFAR
jgi:hypothetical protein